MHTPAKPSLLWVPLLVGMVLPPAPTPAADGVPARRLPPVSSPHFIDDQDLLIHDQASIGDLVGHAKTYPTRALVNPRFRILSGNQDGTFNLDPATGALRVAATGRLDADTAPVRRIEVRVTTQGQRDTAVLKVAVRAARDTVFIDPEHPEDATRDGSITHPYPSPAEVNWSAGKTYLFKRGTTLTSSSAILIGADQVTLGAYGQGKRPVIHITRASAGNIHAIAFINRTGVTLRDLEINATGLTSSLRFGWTRPEAANLTIDTCVARGGAWGIRAFSMQKVNVLYTEVHQIKDDGIFMVGVKDLNLAYNYIHHVNENWVPPYTPQTRAAGDAIQIVNSDRWHVHHNRLDRTNSGNKFCFIATVVPPMTTNTGVLEHNDMIGPLRDGDGGASIYLGKNTGTIHVRYNVVVGPSPGAVYSHATDLRVYGNILANMPESGGVQCLVDQPGTVYNNTFYNIGKHVRGHHLKVYNNIFDTSMDSGHVEIEAFDSLDASHNLFTKEPDRTGALVGSPRFEKPSQLDFRLKAPSPAIDRGRDMGLPEDIDGKKVPRGAGPDIGAHEAG